MAMYQYLYLKYISKVSYPALDVVQLVHNMSIFRVYKRSFHVAVGLAGFCRTNEIFTPLLLLLLLLLTKRLTWHLLPLLLLQTAGSSECDVKLVCYLANTR